MRKCGACGEVGHNRRTCPGVVEEIAELVVEKPEIKTKRKRKPKVCSVCYEEGHTKKSCMYAVEIEGPIGPTKMDCGHFTWWLKDDECELCSRMANLTRKVKDAA